MGNRAATSCLLQSDTDARSLSRRDNEEFVRSVEKQKQKQERPIRDLDSSLTNHVTKYNAGGGGGGGAEKNIHESTHGLVFLV